MFFYNIYGLIIKSEIKLMEIKEISDNNKEDALIHFGKIDQSIIKTINSEDSSKVTDDGIYLFWKDIGSFLVTNKNEIIVDPESCVDMVVPFILGPVLAVLLHQMGKLILHASAVKIDNSVIAFIGDKGNGKSTLATAMYMKGHPIVTDDILVVEFDNDDNPIIYPGFPYSRLSEGIVEYLQGDLNYMSKVDIKYDKDFYYCSDGFSNNPIKLKEIYLIQNNSETFISPLKSNESLIELIRNTFTIKIFQESDKILNLKDCSKIIRKTPIYRLKINHSLEELPKLVNTIENHFNSYKYKKLSKL